MTSIFDLPRKHAYLLNEAVLYPCHYDSPLQSFDFLSLCVRDELKREQRKLQRDIKDFKKRSNADDKVAVKSEEAEEVEEKKDENTEGTALFLETLFQTLLHATHRA